MLNYVLIFLAGVLCGGVGMFFVLHNNPTQAAQANADASKVQNAVDGLKK